MFTRVLRSPDSVDGGADKPAAAMGDDASTSCGQANPAAPAPLPFGGVSGMQPDLRMMHAAWRGGGTLSDEGVRSMLADCCSFLRQIVTITSAVIETIGIGQVRKIVGPELAIPAGVISEDGQAADKAIPAEPERADHRKGPRGAKHPLTVLIQLAVQAAKLLEKIAAGTNPLALGREPIANRLVRIADREQRLTDKANREPYMDFGR